MLTVWVIGSADTAECADRFGGSVCRRVPRWISDTSNNALTLFCSACN